jgi:glycosyltransferase involved in cell wall biosynthesis
LLLRRLGVPYVVHIHGSRFHESWPAGGPLLRGLVNRMFIWSAAIIALGDSWARHIGDNLPEVRSKISIQPNATKSVAARRATPAKAGSVAISFLGALGPRKGTSHLIEALGRLSHLSDWEATIAGNGDIEAYRKLAENLGVGDRLHFPGWLGPDDVDDLLNRSDIFVLPSTAENLPMAILEAFAHGAAVISTPVGAIPEVISHGRNGLLVPVGDVEALADALRQLIEDAPLRRALAEAGHREHAERYDIMPYIVKLTGIWRRAADTKGPVDIKP